MTLKGGICEAKTEVEVSTPEGNKHQCQLLP